MKPAEFADTSTKLRWWQRLLRMRFSLRTALLMMTLLGAGLGMFQRLDRQRQIVAKIEAAGGRVMYSTKPSSGKIENWLRTRLPQSYFDKVSIVYLEKANLANELISEFDEFDFLEYLILKRAKFNDLELRQLARFKPLKGLDLSQTHTSDADLDFIGDLKSLRVLHLDDTQVGDRGLASLAEFKSLEMISVANTQVTETGIQQFKMARPRCSIYTRSGVRY